MRLLVFILIVFFSFKSAFCQKYTLRFNFKESTESVKFSDSIFQSKKQVLNKLDEYYVEMIEKGFLLFSYDSLLYTLIGSEYEFLVENLFIKKP